MKRHCRQEENPADRLRRSGARRPHHRAALQEVLLVKGLHFVTWKREKRSHRIVTSNIH